MVTRAYFSARYRAGSWKSRDLPAPVGAVMKISRKLVSPSIACSHWSTISPMREPWDTGTVSLERLGLS